MFGIFQAIGVIQVILVGVWIFLVVRVRKKKINIFLDHMEPKLAERRYKRLKAFLLVAGISVAVIIVATVVHSVVYVMNEIEEPVSVVIGGVAIWVFCIATIGGLVIFLKGRRKQAKGIPK